jgi:hypothetical protein
MKLCKEKSDRPSFHVKRRKARLDGFDRMYLEALGRCVHAARAARRAALIATLAIAAVGCGYSELEMQAMRDKVARLEQSVIALDGELQQCKPPVGPQ